MTSAVPPDVPQLPPGQTVLDDLTGATVTAVTLPDDGQIHD
jgi:hypothetical protein